ncbi:unnamed protein product, partial [Polarella glacialis]
ATDLQTYLTHNRKIGPVGLFQQVAPWAECQNTELSDGLSLKCKRSPGLSLVIEPTQYDVLTSEFYPDRTRTRWLDPTDATQCADTIKQLETERWLKTDTYRAKVEFITYNADLDCLTMTDIHFMFPSTGKIYKRITQRSITVNAYKKWQVYLFDILFWGLITKIFLAEAKQLFQAMSQKRCMEELYHYWANMWNLVDWVSILLAYTILGMWINQCLMQRTLEGKLEDVEGAKLSCQQSFTAECRQMSVELFNDVESLNQFVMRTRLLTGFYPVCILLRLFKAFSQQARLAVVTRTLYAACGDLAHFGIVFISIFFTYVIMGMSFFGRDNSSFSNFGVAVVTVFESIMGGANVEEMRVAGHPIAFFYFASFMCIAVLLLLNMLIAIIMDVYAETKHRALSSDPVWQDVGDLFVRMWGNYKG